MVTLPMSDYRNSILYPHCLHLTDLLLVDVHQQRHFFSVEKNPEEVRFLNAMLTMFHRLGRLDLVNHAQNSPFLHLAAFYGWDDVSNALLNLGSNPDVQDSKGLTALHVACASVEVNSTEIVRVLLEKGADPNLKADVTGFAPIHHLIEASRKTAEPWDCIGKLETLLKGGADIDARDIRGQTPIHIASCIPWCNSIFDHLFKRGARLDILDVTRRSVLHCAALYGDLDHITYLRKLGLTEPDPEGKDYNDQTPLNLMVWRRNAELEELGKNMIRPNDEEFKDFRSLIKEMSIHRWREWDGTSYQNDCSRWDQVDTANHLNPQKHHFGPPTRRKIGLTTPPSSDQEMHVKERRASHD